MSIAQTKNNTCPVAMLEHYLCVVQISVASKEFLFRIITRRDAEDMWKVLL